MNNILRVIKDKKIPATENMAIDEVLLDSCIKYNTSTLRFYYWENPTLSLGRNQKLSDINLKELEKNHFDIVRRPTGGNAVFHDDEITYSATFKIPQGKFGSIVESCRLIHLAMAKALNKMGIITYLSPSMQVSHKNPKASDPVCFAHASDTELIYDGIKLIGSAQMRRSGCLMQHGSIPFSIDKKKLLSLFSKTDCTEDDKFSLGLPIRDKQEVFMELFAKSLANNLGLTEQIGDYTNEEKEAIKELRKNKYMTKEWIERR